MLELAERLTTRQIDELRHISSESGVASVPWGGGRYQTGFVGPRNPHVAACLYRLGLLKRDRVGERESLGSRWRYYWAYAPTPEVAAALRARAADTPSVKS